MASVNEPTQGLFVIMGGLLIWILGWLVYLVETLQPGQCPESSSLTHDSFFCECMGKLLIMVIKIHRAKIIINLSRLSPVRTGSSTEGTSK